VSDEPVPVLGVTDTAASARWYARMGFETVGGDRSDPGGASSLLLRREGVHLRLSERDGDESASSLVYFYVADVDAIAVVYGVEPTDRPWAREIELIDPDGNRLHIGTIPS
jgi:catechol 2,3-dioxygenase-like lactoylglutathione lyase family enzyme